MSDRQEQFWVGICVMIAAAMLAGVALSASGALTSKGNIHRAYFKFASGVMPAAPVRYGGFLAGKVEKLRVDPEDSTRIEIEFTVDSNIPVKTDSVAKISTLGALGDNYLEITTGTRGSPLAPPGSALKSQEALSINDLADLVGGLPPVAEKTLNTLNARLDEMKVTIAQVNDLLSDRNRQNVGASLANLNAMLADTRPKISATLTNVQTASESFPQLAKNAQAATEKITPLLDDLKGTVKQANDTLAKVDAVLVENRPDIRATMMQIRKTMESASKAVDLLKGTLDRNADNLDESLDNVRVATDNLRELTDTLKRKPSVLIRGEVGKDRQPGGTK